MPSFDETTKTWKGLHVPYPYRDVHISEIILKSLKKTPNRVLQIYDENFVQMTCEELRLKATRVAQNLTKLGIKRGDVVGFNCSNSENICALLNGCVFIGAISNSMALAHDKNDLVHMWRQTEPKCVFCDAEVFEKVVEALSDMGSNATVCTLIERKDNILFVDDILANTGIEEDFVPLKCTNSLSSSSGTTGPSKAVCVTQYYIMRFADMFQDYECRFIHFGPIFWNTAFALFIILPLTKLTRVVTKHLGSVENYFEFVEKFKIEYLSTNPTLLKKFLQSPLIQTANLSSLKIVSSVGAILHPDLRIQFKQTFWSRFMEQLNSFLCFRC